MKRNPLRMPLVYYKRSRPKPMAVTFPSTPECFAGHLTKQETAPRVAPMANVAVSVVSQAPLVSSKMPESKTPPAKVASGAGSPEAVQKQRAARRLNALLTGR